MSTYSARQLGDRVVIIIDRGDPVAGAILDTTPMIHDKRRINDYLNEAR